MTANNSKLEQLEKLESYGDICFPDNPRDKNPNQYYDPEEAIKKEVEAEIEEQLQEDDEEDLRDLEFLEEFDNEQTTLELSNLYTSCLEWILNRPVSTLNSQLMIDDYEKIQYPAALVLLMNLVG